MNVMAQAPLLYPKTAGLFDNPLAPACLACDAPVAAVYERLAERVPEIAERVDFTVPKPDKISGSSWRRGSRSRGLLTYGAS